MEWPLQNRLHHPTLLDGRVGPGHDGDEGREAEAVGEHSAQRLLAQGGDLGNTVGQVRYTAKCRDM